MKKVLSILAIVGLTAGLAACGQSAEEKAKQEAAAIQLADSLKNAMEASVTNAVSEAVATDSTAAATTETTAPAEEKK